MAKILVTGGAGFIGSHVTDALLTAGHEVHVLDNLSSGKRENVPAHVPLYVLDIQDASFEKIFRKEKFEILIHHAAQMDVRKSVADPTFDASINILGFLNLMEIGKQNGLKKVVFASTGGAIYGEPEAIPQDETHTLQPVSPYGITKLTTEKYLYYYQQQYGIDYVALRYANVYGPRQNPHGEAGVVAIFTQKLLAGEQPFINGDGLQTRDYVYVGDLVKMNLHALNYPTSGIFNVGTGIETNVVALFRIINKLTGNRATEQHAPAKPGEQMRSVLSYELATKTFGWKPEVSIEEGLEATVSWFQKQSSR